MSDDRRLTRVILGGCSHELRYGLHTPSLGETITCFFCNRPRRVIGKRLAYWQARCRDCDWTETFGAKKTQCRDKARMHAKGKTHVVDVIDPMESLFERVRPPSGIQGALFSVGDYRDITCRACTRTFRTKASAKTLATLAYKCPRCRWKPADRRTVTGS